MCRKAAGSFVGVLLDDLHWTRGTPARLYSSNGIARGFCAACGTPLFLHNEASPRIPGSIGAFDDPGAFPLAFERGIEARLPQVDTLSDLPNFGTSEEDYPEATARAARTSRQDPDHDTEIWPAPS